MNKKPPNPNNKSLSNFNRKFFDSEKRLTGIGYGSLGGKAQNLVLINNILADKFNSSDFKEIEVNVPTMSVIRSDVFDAFMKRNNLIETALSDLSDDRIAHVFQKADLPTEILGDLRALINQVHTPLAIRSSSILEDAMYEPFAGIYATKMIPNNQHSPDIRFRKLLEAIKFVYASTYFKAAKNYIKATKHSIENEKMAVIIQEVVGKRFNNRFYPEISGVARSYNYYAINRAKPEDGVVNLALGLGKTIVDSGLSWTYSPALPKISPPFGSINEMLKQTQTGFWGVNMGQAPAYDPIAESEYLLKLNIADAEEDGTLRFTASTLDVQSGRINPGIGRKGPRIINFSMLLVFNEIPLNDLIKSLLSTCEEVLNAPVEIEFAMTFSERKQSLSPHKFGFLQVRPMVISEEKVEITNEEMTDEKLLIASENVLGNGSNNLIQDVIYIKPENFEAKFSPKIANELENINKKLLIAKSPYLLIGFGRWGSSDPWLGIPVDWGQVSGAKVIVEATQANINVELSQGSHFFHNLTSFKVSYFSVPYAGKYKIDWNWLNEQYVIEETNFIRHVKLYLPLKIKIDGRNGRGVIIKE